MPSGPGLFHLSLKATGLPSFGFAFLCCVGLTVVHKLSSLHAKILCVETNMAEIVVFTVLATCLYVTL